jgi:hypothetical protein
MLTNNLSASRVAASIFSRQSMLQVVFNHKPANSKERNPQSNFHLKLGDALYALRSCRTQLSKVDP